MKTPTYYYKKVGTQVPADHPVRKIIELALWELKQRFHPDKTVKCLLFADASPRDYDFTSTSHINGTYRTGTEGIKVKMRESLFKQLKVLAHEVCHYLQFNQLDDPEKHMDIEAEAWRFGKDFALDFTDDYEESFKRAQTALEKWMKENPPSGYNRELRSRLKREKYLEPIDEFINPWGGWTLA